MVSNTLPLSRVALAGEGGGRAVSTAVTGGWKVVSIAMPAVVEWFGSGKWTKVVGVGLTAIPERDRGSRLQHSL